MGNGEEYIWKPPDDEDFMVQHKQIGTLAESIQPSAAGVSFYECVFVCVCLAECLQTLLNTNKDHIEDNSVVLKLTVTVPTGPHLCISKNPCVCICFIRSCKTNRAVTHH